MAKPGSGRRSPSAVRRSTLGGSANQAVLGGSLSRRGQARLNTLFARGNANVSTRGAARAIAGNNPGQFGRVRATGGSRAVAIRNGGTLNTNTSGARAAAAAGLRRPPRPRRRR